MNDFIQIPPQSNANIDIEVKSIRSALPLDAEMARSALRRIERIVDILRDERDRQAPDISRWINQHNEFVFRYNDMLHRTEEAQRILRGEDIHEDCGY